ncbi:MurR/RpiR family transcriptional regulator (plasmid) [Rhodobacteraceae bacterium SC52]|uniref:MurR/RpiR family transcriptional regulator n=2 Tax=Meridianimarinicoccus aquatilis TaxID=2552766 RepID=A0A4R6B2U9_9RHOB|nr:MurR/RpiR family transcriptional regulator [Rhodobacteraceae bacterium SC52]TDL90535.1 MurR/RpiR family transcriptional regulator [Fluviibacterium aquatile]
MRRHMAQLTLSERHLASVLMEDYPIAGLQSITELAQAAQVSTPTVVRMARKLGLDGFSALQEALRSEISDQIKKPMSKLDEIAAEDQEAHKLYRFAAAVFRNLHGTLARVDQDEFDTAAALMADPARSIFIEGGRITRSNADYLFNHLQIIRPGVTDLGRSSGVWPQYLLDMDANSVLVLFDIRRYESDLLKLAKLAKARGSRIVLFTDQWGSPIGQLADICFNSHVEAPSSWDSTIAVMLLIEALIAEVQTLLADESRTRIEELESMFTATRMFRDFN